MTDQGTCVVAGCTKPGTNRLLHEDEQRALTVRVTLCEEHEHVCGALDDNQDGGAQ